MFHMSPSSRLTSPFIIEAEARESVPAFSIKPLDVVLQSWIVDVTPGVLSASTQPSFGPGSLFPALLSRSSYVIKSILDTIGDLLGANVFNRPVVSDTKQIVDSFSDLLSANVVDWPIVPAYSYEAGSDFGYDHAYFRTVDIVGVRRIYRRTTVRFIWLRRLPLNLKELGRHLTTFLERSGGTKQRSPRSKKSQTSHARPKINLPLMC